MLHPQPTTRTQPTEQTRTSTHRRVTAYALAGSAVLVGVSGLVSPAHNGDADGLLTAATTASARVTAGAVILIVSRAARRTAEIDERPARPIGMSPLSSFDDHSTEPLPELCG